MTTAEQKQHVHKDPDQSGFCRSCGEPMPGNEALLKEAFDAGSTPANTTMAAPDSSGTLCVKCRANHLQPGDICCEYCGWPVTWENGVAHQEPPPSSDTDTTAGNGTHAASSATLGTTPAPDATPAKPTYLIPDPDVSAPSVPSTGTGYLKVIVRVNRNIFNHQVEHPEYPAPYDNSAHAYEVDGVHAVIGRLRGDPAIDDDPQRINCLDKAVHTRHALLDRRPDGEWEIRRIGTNRLGVNHNPIPLQTESDPVGSGQPLKAGDILWLGYYTEIEVVALA